MKKALQILSHIGLPFTFFSALWLKIIRKVGIGYFEEKIFMATGILPIPDQYYQPLINPKKHLLKSLREDRELPGIDFNTEEQLDLISKFDYNRELEEFPIEKSAELTFFYNNGSYASGDAEYLYNIVRHFKPKRIIEIGSGLSTFMVQNALSKNKIDNPDQNCNHICIEPYEHPNLEKLGIEIIRKRVETVDKSFFKTLEHNDILFIDSSHMIRPQGDVLFEYLEILPILNPGVIVHIHDIFMPKDYLNEWIYDAHLLWNEQYLLEAFLTFNDKYKIIGSLNYLAHNYNKEFSAKCPIFAQQNGREPGAFWMVRK